MILNQDASVHLLELLIWVLNTYDCI